MLTARGFWFLVTAVVVLGLGVVFGVHLLTLVGLTLLPWFLTRWLLFQVRWLRAGPTLRVERTLQTPQGSAATLWAGQTVAMRVAVHADRVLLPIVVVSDRLPPLAELLDGDLRAEGALGQAEPRVLECRFRCPAPGTLRFEGVQVFAADPHGFFAVTHFVRRPVVVRVLPALTPHAGHPAFVKRQNVLPLLGSHRHLRPGSGTELLDLREYLPGDPPKMIAWKTSARRDRLMTRELESEVPIRCTLFLDTSSSVRVGPPGRTALARLVEIAAGVAQAAGAERDLTGLCLFDETGVGRRLRPGRGSRHLMQLLDALTDAASLLPTCDGADLDALLAHGYALVQDFYPDLLDPDVNRFPPWLPFWSPQPRWTQRGRTQPATLRGWLRDQAQRSTLRRLIPQASRFLPSAHRRYRRRKQLAAILAVRYDLGPGGLARLLEDDRACSALLQRFLADHQVAFPFPLYDARGQYLFAAPAKLRVLADALVQAVARGKENELFVVCIDPFDAEAPLEPVERAIALARSRHHQVVVLCPWPADAPTGPPPAGDSTHLDGVLARAGSLRLHQALGRVRQAFGRFGVPVLAAGAKDSIAQVLQRIQRLRGRVRGATR